MVWKTATSIFTAALLYGGSIENASAAVIIDAQETGGNVVFSFSGTLDIGGLSLVLSDPGGSPSGAINPFDISFRSIPSAFDEYDGLSTSGFGQNVNTTTSSVSGSSFGILGTTLLVPIGYTGGQISGSSTYVGHTFASLGLDLGSFTFGVGGRDTITLNVPGEGSTAVPEPSTLSLIGLGLLGLGAMRRRRQSEIELEASPFA